MHIYLVILIIVGFSEVKACRDLYPDLCKTYKNNDRVDTCTYYTTKKWMRANCMKSCNLCHLYTTLPPTTQKPRTVPPMVGCGKSFVQQSRVIAGQEAKAGAWPWQVALLYRGRFMCGASIVSSQWLVTAAHCVVRASPRYLVAVLGEHNRNSTEGTEVTYKVTRIYIHHSYRVSKENDVAVIRLDRPVIMNKRIQRVCLPDQGNAPPEGSTCVITGWGKMKHPGKGATILQQASLKTISQDKCAKKNNRLGPRVTSAMLCAGIDNSRKSGCHGDSGGPLVCQAKDSRWFLHGVVSWGSPTCNSKHGYSVFAKVSSVRQWIDNFVWY